MSVLCAIPILSSLLSACAPAAPLAVGYVEGDYVLLAPIEVATVESVSVRRGERIYPGVTIATLESRDARLALAEADAGLAQAQAQLADLKLGRRPEEIAVLEAALASGKAQADEARRVHERTRDLFKRGIATQAQLDEAQTRLEVAEAAIGQAEANLAVAALPARAETIKAAQNLVQQAQAKRDQASWRLGKRAIQSPTAGRVDDVIRTAGDTAGPSAPVLSVLPDGAVKLKLFVPEASLARIAQGTALRVHCDGCGAGMTAHVSYVSPDPEFTPPVIYSLETRQKLVYLVEARPDDGATALKPGQIVDVEVGE